MVIHSAHDLKDLLSHKARTLLSPSCIQLIHVALLGPPEFSFELCPTLNSATLIPNFSEPPIHTCNETLEDLIPQFSHISSAPLNNPDLASPGSMYETGCSGMVHWDDPEGWEGEGGGRGFRMGNICTPMADSCECMAKTTTIL